MTKTYVAGVGMTDFLRPGRHDHDYPDLVAEAVGAALADAGIAYEDVEHAFAGYVYGESTAGQRAIYGVGRTGIPIVNVNNNCASGSSALALARQLVAAGAADCALAFGFERMAPGSLPSARAGQADPLGPFYDGTRAIRGENGGPAAPPLLFGAAGREHMERYGTTAEQFARVAVKNHRHSVANPRAQFRDEYSLAEVLDSPVVHAPLTRLQSCPTSDGAAAAVVVGERFARERGLLGRAVEIAALELVTDRPGSYDGDSCIELVGAGMTRDAAARAYEGAGIGPAEVDVIELHDCFSTNELITYEALGLCAPGGGGELIDSGAVTYGGEWVVNPSGGLISKGHPLGATGLAQCAELTWQLRGEAGGRQVDGARVALQHNLGLGGAVVVGLYRAPENDDE